MSYAMTHRLLAVKTQLKEIWRRNKNINMRSKRFPVILHTQKLKALHTFVACASLRNLFLNLVLHCKNNYIQCPMPIIVICIHLKYI